MRLVLTLLPSAAKFIETFQDPLFDALGHRRHRIILIVEREIIENLLALLTHAAHPVANDHGDFIGKGRIISEQRGNRARQDMAVAILMLQSFTVERRPSRGGTGPKSF